jgi:hypothetical protein
MIALVRLRYRTLKLRALCWVLRRVGEMLRETERAQGKRTDLVPKEYQVDSRLTFDEIGLSKKESALAQKIAALPEEDFQQIKEGATRRKLATGLTCASYRALPNLPPA